MKVAYCADRTLYHLVLTSVNSLLSNNNDVETVYLFIEDDSIPFITDSRIKFINCNNFEFLIREGINVTRRYPYMALVRCFFAKIIDEPKIIYLDVDTIVDGDISELWNMNIRNYAIGAYIENSEGYFNSGVLLMNIEYIKNSKLDDILIQLLKTCKFRFPDQDAMNFVFRNSVLPIPSYFNKMGGDVAYSTKYIIRHFASGGKPWKSISSDTDKELWNKYKVDKVTNLAI